MDAANCPVEDESFPAALFITRLVARIASFGRYLLRVWSGQQQGFEVWADVLAPKDDSRLVCALSASTYVSFWLCVHA